MNAINEEYGGLYYGIMTTLKMRFDAGLYVHGLWVRRVKTEYHFCQVSPQKVVADIYSDPLHF